MFTVWGGGNVVKSHTPNDPLVVAPPRIPYMLHFLVSRAYVTDTTSWILGVHMDPLIILGKQIAWKIFVFFNIQYTYVLS